MSSDDRWRELLNEIAPSSEPAPNQVEEARADLHAAFRAESAPQRLARRVPRLAWAGAAVAAVAVAAALTLPGSSSPVDASLESIARATREVSAQDLPAGSFIYWREDSTVLSSGQPDESAPPLFYLLPESLEFWVQGGAEVRNTTVGTPTFFDDDSAAAYFAAGLDIVDGVGTTRSEVEEDVPNLADINRWSHDRATLQEQIADELVKAGDPDLAEDLATLRLVEELLGPRFNAPPRLRAALIEIVGTHDIESTKLDDGSVIARLEYDDPGIGRAAQELVFDDEGYLRASRWLVLEPGPDLPVPPGTALAATVWSRPYVVDGAGVLPDGP